MITGTVTDQSPNTDLNGTPAISDADQGRWMDYMVTKTIAEPTNVTGVNVILTSSRPQRQLHQHRHSHKRPKRSIQETLDTRNRRRIHHQSDIHRISIVWRIISRNRIRRISTTGNNNTTTPSSTSRQHLHHRRHGHRNNHRNRTRRSTSPKKKIDNK